MRGQRFESDMDLWKPVRSYAELHYYHLYTQQFRHQLEVAYGVVEEIEGMSNEEEVASEAVAAD